MARPHQFALTGQKVTLDGSRSWSADGKIARYEWTFTDGSKAEGATVERTYDKAGYYSEVLKITDAAGRVDYDFAIVFVVDPKEPDRLPPSIHVASHPTLPSRPARR